MINKITRPLMACGCLALAGVLTVTLFWSREVAWGVAVGGLWNLANLWCLMQLLAAWVEKGRNAGERAGLWSRFWQKPWAWALIKFPLLYGVVVLLFLKTSLSLVGFGIGFTAVLLAAIGVHLWIAQKEALFSDGS